MGNPGYHFRLRLVRYTGQESEYRHPEDNWAGAQDWFRKETGKKLFRPRMVQVYFCKDLAGSGQLRSDDEVILLERIR